ncbi:ADP-ribosylation factor-like protein 13A [Mycena kentingensis (nom. inval.)]|nr:ADP-ribosylation factor-like protein 13A [Mycena kentingensis (nom. inval.)]
MGAIVSSPLYAKSFTVIILGLDGCGKTSLLNRLRRREFPYGVLPQTTPTIGFTRETIAYGAFGRHRICIWDMGGLQRVRPMWREYVWNGNAFVFVVDASKPDRLPEARKELEQLVRDDLQGKAGPFLVLANKIDRTDAVSVQEIEQALGLEKLLLTSGRAEWLWAVKGVSGLAGEGVIDAVDWTASRQCKDAVDRDRRAGATMLYHQRCGDPSTANSTLPLMGTSTSKSLTVSMVGLDGAGKTSILFRLVNAVLDPKDVPAPTIGSNIETVSHKKNRITLWDMGGTEKIRPLWRRNFWHAHAFIFVVDAAAPERILEARETLEQHIYEHGPWEYPFLLVANKIDAPNAASLAEIEEALGMKKLFRQHTKWPWAVVGVSAMTGEGLTGDARLAGGECTGRAHREAQ